MIIQAKASRPTGESDDPRKRFVFDNTEKLSRIPVYFAMMILGIAAYLKSALPVFSMAEPAPEREPEDASRVRAPQDVEVASVDGTEEEVDPTETGSIDKPVPQNSISSINRPWGEFFQPHDPIELRYSVASFEHLGAKIAAYFPAAFVYLPHNDNNDAGSAQVSAPTTFKSLPVVTGPADGKVAEPDEGGEDDHDNEPDEDDEEDNDNQPQTNRAPIVVGPVRLHDVFAGHIVLIGLSHLLFGASDPDGDALIVSDISASGGQVTPTSNGWTFSTLPGSLGVTTLSYKISDGVHEVQQTATVQIIRNTVELTNGHDVFVGTPFDDDIAGRAGDDIIDARAGNDLVDGGDGDDHIQGGNGDDHLLGGYGDDVIFGGNGNDLIGGGAGNDRLFGDAGNDIIDGDEGNDLVMGGDGDDIIDGGAGDDELLGEDGDDVIHGGEGADLAEGGLGRDVINGEAGADHLSGGEGDDIIGGGAGDDLLFGDAGNDIINGDEGNDLVMGGDGDDVIHGGAGLDVVEGGLGQDLILGEAGQDQLSGGEGDDVIDGGEGDDTISGDAGDDTLRGGAGDDEVSGGEGNDTVIGDAGDDSIDGGAGTDVLDYSDSDDDLLVDFVAGIAEGESIGTDTFSNMEQAIGGSGNDTFIVGATATVITGGRGDDLFIFTVTDNAPQLSQQLVHQILDFVIGDRIRVADYSISRGAERTEEERFDDLYDDLEDAQAEGNFPIKVSYGRYDNIDTSIIEADFDGDNNYEIAIRIDGIHLPFHFEHNIT